MRTNPRIDAERGILMRLHDMEFDTESYTGEFIDNNWKPNFHYYQGVEAFRHQITLMIDKLNDEQEAWEKQRKAI